MASYGKGNVETIPVGAITTTGRATADTGYLLCIGTAVSRIIFANLFTVIGTTFGVGDGSTTFNLPDFKGATPAGVGTSTGYTTNETVALGTKYNDAMQTHRHQIVDGGANIYGIRGYVGFTAGSLFIPEITGGTDTVRASTIDSPGRTGTATKGKTVGINFQIKY